MEVSDVVAGGRLFQACTAAVTGNKQSLTCTVKVYVSDKKVNTNTPNNAAYFFQFFSFDEPVIVCVIETMYK